MRDAYLFGMIPSDGLVALLSTKLVIPSLLERRIRLSSASDISENPDSLLFYLANSMIPELSPTDCYHKNVAQIVDAANLPEWSISYHPSQKLIYANPLGIPCASGLGLVKRPFVDRALESGRKMSVGFRWVRSETEPESVYFALTFPAKPFGGNYGTDMICILMRELENSYLVLPSGKEQKRIKAAQPDGNASVSGSALANAEDVLGACVGKVMLVRNGKISDAPIGIAFRERKEYNSKNGRSSYVPAHDISLLLSQGSENDGSSGVQGCTPEVIRSAEKAARAVYKRGLPFVIPNPGQTSLERLRYRILEQIV